MLRLILRWLPGISTRVCLSSNIYVIQCSLVLHLSLWFQSKYSHFELLQNVFLNLPTSDNINECVLTCYDIFSVCKDVIVKASTIVNVRLICCRWLGHRSRTVVTYSSIDHIMYYLPVITMFMSREPIWVKDQVTL